MLAARTPVYDEDFLYDWKPLDSPVMGRHQTEVWKQGTGGTHISDTIEIGQPDLNQQWQRIDSGECQDACNPPSVTVSYGTKRGEHYMEQMRINSGLFCLTQLRHNTQPSEQITRIMSGLKKIPEMYNTDFLQVHAVDQAPSVAIASAGFPTWTPIRGTNTSGQLTTIDLGSAALLPQSQLTFPMMNYWTTTLGLNGYSEAGSGLGDGIYNLITDPYSWFKMTNGAESMKDMMALTDAQQASPLYKVGQGIQKPFGNIAPTLNKMPIRFQLMSGGSGGLLNRVYPYFNVAATTGIMRIPNPAYIQARYQLSFIWHPKAIKIWTPDFKKMADKVPTVNSAMYGQWQLINNQGLLRYTQPDGTVCDKDNTDQVWFYWRSAMELGFQYMYPELMLPILHQVDGSGFNTAPNDPACGSAPAYTAQNYYDSPQYCVAET
jgi:hypothetical protein